MLYCVIIRGPMASGKSTIAKRLSNILKAKYISIDKILEKHGLDKISNDVIPVKNFIKANKIIIPQVRKTLSNGKSVIIDGCFYYNEQIKDINRNLKYPHFVFTLKTPVDVCIERDGKRSKTYGKDATTTVHKLVSKFNCGTIIDTDKPLDKIIDEILSCINNKKTENK